MTTKKFFALKNKCCNSVKGDCFDCPLDEVAICDMQNTVFTTLTGAEISRAEEILAQYDNMAKVKEK